MKKKLINYIGLLGVISLISYAAAVIFAPLAYPGYDRLSMAVSDLSAETAPSRMLWNRLSALYMPCGIACCTACCIAAERLQSKFIRIGIYLFALMNFISAAGYTMFPLSDAGNVSGFQNAMHIGITVAVVLLSIVSLVLIICGGLIKKAGRGIGICAGTALFLMMIGAIGTNIVPREYFGVVERFGTFAAVGFNAALGIYLYAGFGSGREKR